MEKIIMLGTGHGSVIDLYNTCFLLENGEDRLLVDTGGSIRIVENLEKMGYKLTDIHNIFISHCHTDHILGLCWFFRRVSMVYYKTDYKEKINIYGNEEVVEAIDKLISAVFPKLLQDIIKKNIVIHVLKSEETIDIAGEKITFFDAWAKGNSLYGFETVLTSGKKLVFLGDEICNQSLYNRIKDADYVMHEAFCMDSEEGVPQVVKEHHSTVKSVCEAMEPLNIKNLIIYHTEDSHKDKKELYEKEAKQYFSNNVIVPNDLEIIEIK